MSPLEPDPLGNDLRRSRCARGIPPDAACVICGERDPEALRRAQPGVLERHHVAGRANDADLTVFVCLTHHRLLTLQQAGIGVELDRGAERSPLERLVSVLRGLALFFEQLARSLVLWADSLETLIVVLDAHFPAWRELAPR